VDLYPVQGLQKDVAEAFPSLLKGMTMAITGIQDKLGLSTKADDLDRKLDEAVADSFPASDPVALAQPHDPEELGVRRSAMSFTHWMLLGGGLLAVIAIIALRR
jgi:hypothetical protein